MKQKLENKPLFILEIKVFKSNQHLEIISEDELSEPDITMVVAALEIAKHSILNKNLNK
jgi:hypothetical protein